jgi:hypothetical protein
MAAFGKLVKGMPLLREMQIRKSNGDMFTEKIIITNIQRVR